MVLAHCLGHVVRQDFEGLLIFFLNKCLLSDCYSFNKHVVSTYCAPGPVLGVRELKMKKIQTQNSVSSVREVRDQHQLTQHLVENASCYWRLQMGCSVSTTKEKGASLGQKQRRLYFMVAPECWRSRKYIPPHVYHVKVTANRCKTPAGRARHCSQVFPPITHSMTWMEASAPSPFEMQIWSQAANSRAHALDLHAGQSLYYTKTAIPETCLPLPPGPSKAKEIS